MSLPCWVKWALSVIGGSASLVVFGVLAVLVLFGGIFLLIDGIPWIGRRVGRRIVPDPDRRARAWAFVFGDDGGRGLRGLGLVNGTALGLVVAAILCVASMGFLSEVWGCDACLPAFLQRSCAAASSATEARDREDLDRIRAIHPDWRPVPPDDATGGAP